VHNDVAVEIGRLMLDAFVSIKTKGTSETSVGDSDAPSTDHESGHDDSNTAELNPPA
jgi:hypothetical protein